MKIWAFTICMIFGGAFSLRADTIVTVDTSTLAGTSGQLAFDFIEGGSPSNSVTISGFTTDGSLGSNFPSGGVSGTFPGTVVLTDSSFFNEYLTDITLGSTFSFDLSATTNPPDAASVSDAFSLFLLDPNTGLPLFTTADPTGANSLLTLNIDGSAPGALSVYDASVTTAPATTAVPEPATLLLMGTGLLALLRKRKAYHTEQYK